MEEYEQEEGTRVCITCGKEKAYNFFERRGKGNRKRRNVCMACRRIERPKNRNKRKSQVGKFTKYGNRAKKREEILVNPVLKAKWAEWRTQYEPFLQDVLIPRATNVYTPLVRIYKAYQMYCKATGVPALMPVMAMSSFLKENFVRSTSGVVRFGCEIRPGIFVEDEGDGVLTEKKV
jgi:hypothetical protein